MKKRIITGIVILAIFIPLLVVEDLFFLFQVLMMGLVLVAAYEMIKLYETKQKFPGKSKLVIMGGALLIYLSALAEWSLLSKWHDSPLAIEGLKLLNINVGFLSMLLIILLVCFTLLVIYEDFDGASVGKAMATMTYTGLGFAALTIFRFSGVRYVVYLFLITISTDVFAYVFGVNFGKHKMAPKISPKKSWEGAIGGTIVATVLATAFALYYGKMFGSVFGPQDTPTLLHNFIALENYSKFAQVSIVIGVTLSISVFSQIGDLVASKLKRTYEIKDFGQIFPGHGGVLDRLDSALFASLFLLSLFTVLNQVMLVS